MTVLFLRLLLVASLKFNLVHHWTLPGELSKFNRFVVSRRLYYSTKIELGNENICARSYFRKYAVLLVVTDYWFVFLQLIMINRVEKSLRHVAVVAKYLDNHKPKTSLKRWIRTASNFIDLNQIHLIWQMLAKYSMVESERTVSRFRRGKRQLLCCVYLLYKAIVWNYEVACRRDATTGKKWTK